MSPHVLIAGGGVAGLACAVALADLGLRVDLYERDARLGGRAGSVRDAHTGDVIDIGPHVLTSEHRNFCRLLQRVGTAHQVCWQPDPMVTLLDRGRHLHIRSWSLPPPLQGLPNLGPALHSVTAIDLASNWRVAWTAAHLDESRTLALDDEDALAFLARLGVTPRFVAWFWRPLALALLNVPLAHCSAAALMRVFRLMLGRSGYHFGFPKIGLAELFAPGCRRVIEAAGGRVFTGLGVREAALREGRFDSFVLDDGRSVHAPCGVLALPPRALTAAAPPAWREPDALPALVHLFEPCPYVCSVLWFDRPVTHERFWARVWRPGDLNFDFYDLSNIRGSDAQAPSMVASNAIHAHAAWRWSDARIVERTRREIVEFAPAAAGARVRHAAVHRVPMAIACPHPGTERRRPPVTTPFGNLWIAGDWTATQLPCSMESAARSGAMAAEAVAAQLGCHRALAQPVPETTGVIGALRSGWTAPGIAGPRELETTGAPASGGPESHSGDDPWPG